MPELIRALAGAVALLAAYQSERNRKKLAKVKRARVR
jgi:hypothetical protein